MSKSDAANKPNKTEHIGICSGPPFLMGLRGLTLRLVNIFSFYELGTALGNLRTVGWLPSKEALSALLDADRQLRLPRSRGKQFLEPLNPTVSGISVDIDESVKHLVSSERVGEGNERLLNKSLDEFEHAFALEEFYQRVFGVEKLRAYMMPLLGDGADQAFSPAVVKLCRKMLRGTSRRLAAASPLSFPQRQAFTWCAPARRFCVGFISWLRGKIQGGWTSTPFSIT